MNLKMNVEKMLDIILHLQPNMSEYADNSLFMYWMDYACELDTVSLLIQANTNDFEKVVTYMNKVMKTFSSDKPSHHACVDIASTFEEAFQEMKGEFVYG